MGRRREERGGGGRKGEGEKGEEEGGKRKERSQRVKSRGSRKQLCMQVYMYLLTSFQPVSSHSVLY